MIILDKYFKYSLIIEWSVSIIITLIFTHLIRANIIKPLEYGFYTNLASDVSNVALTSSGFFLTILTLLVSFKNTFMAVRRIDESESLFKTFFSMKSLYNGTIIQMKTCIFNLVMAAGIMFVSRISLINEFCIYLLPVVSGSLFLVFSSNFRCLLILNKIINYDK